MPVQPDPRRLRGNVPAIELGRRLGFRGWYAHARRCGWPWWSALAGAWRHGR